MKSIVVYYSLDGHTRAIANQVAEETGAELFELKPRREKKREGFAKFFFGGMHAIFHQKPKLETELPDLNDYDLIVVGTPVWASGYVPAVHTFLSAQKLRGKKIALFACHASDSPGNALMNMEKALDGNEILASIHFRSPKSEDAAVAAQVKGWVAQIKEKL